MRIREPFHGFNAQGLAVRAIAGLHVVLIGIDIEDAARPGVLGFAIERTDHTESERYFLRGFKTFPGVDVGIRPGTPVSMRDHPVQAFFWGDYTAKPAHDYTYRVVALSGAPRNLVESAEVSVRVQTEHENRAPHAAYFNRGVAASQAYALRFGAPPNQLAEPKRTEAFRWLSRGLVERLEAFLGQASGPAWAIHGCVYEFANARVLAALKGCADAGADVAIVYDAKDNSDGDPRDRNEAAIAAAGLGGNVVARKGDVSFIAHNKFFVLLHNGTPVAVWTGSTNITDGGIFGHSNVGHVARDADVAASYDAFWARLHADPGVRARDLRPLNVSASPLPPAEPAPGTISLFSPRNSLMALEWYRDRLAAAQESAFFTAAFGVNSLFTEVLSHDSPALRYVLLEGMSPEQRAALATAIADTDNRFAVGSILTSNVLERWLAEQNSGLNTHVRYIHTKYLLIDALTDDPLLVTGSANFSEASTKNNDENMLVIRGDTGIADIYLGEFMRLFNHFFFRQFAGRPGNQPNLSLNLEEDWHWSDQYFVPGAFRARQRLLFAGN